MKSNKPPLWERGLVLIRNALLRTIETDIRPPLASRGNRPCQP